MDPRLLPTLQSEGMRGHPYRPASLRDVPPAALEDLRAVIGAPTAERLFVLPPSRRTVDPGHSGWVTTPQRVIGIGADEVVLWVEDGTRPGVRTRVPYTELIAVLDLSVLLLGRLEIVGERDSFVVRYNAVNRPDLRDMLLPLRRSARVAPGPLPSTNQDPRDLPLKWLNVVRSTDVQPAGPGEAAVVVGGLHRPKLRAHAGVAVLTHRELVVATNPTADPRDAQYGVDLVAVPRARIVEVAGTGDLLEIRIHSPRPTTIWLSVDNELADEVRSRLGSVSF